jgi:polyferredoxin
MPNESPMNDPRNIWQNQPKEPFKMSVDEMRHRAQRFQMKARLTAAASIASALLVCAFFAWNFARTHELVPRMGYGLISLCGIFMAYSTYKWVWPSNLSADAPVSTSLKFYRSELERRRDYRRHVWRRTGLTYLFLGLAMVVVPALIAAFGAPRLFLNMIPFFLLLIIWFVLFFRGKKRSQHKLQQEIDELRAFERDR